MQDNPTPAPIVPTATVPMKPNLLAEFTNAIAIYEGAETPGTIPYKTHNCGDLRWPYGAPYPYGATGVASGDFLVFPDAETGMNALETYVIRVINGLSKVYPKNCTIAQFFAIYAPSNDNNDPNAYAEWVAKRCGLSTADPLSKLIG